MKFAIVLAAVVSTVAMGRVQSSTNQLEVVFGGYAIIVSGGQTLDVATIKKPNIFSTDYEPHPLHVSVGKGTIHLGRTTVPPEHLGHGTVLGWDLTGLTAEILSEGNPLPREQVTLPQYSNVDPCDENVPANQVNNRFFLPDLTRIANQQQLKADLDSRLDGRLTVHGGTLRVTSLVEGCFDFKKDEVTVRPQRIAHGLKGLTYSHPIGSYVILRLKKKGRPFGDVAIVPEGGTVRLDIYPRHSGDSVPGRPIKHFKYFYSLLRKSVGDDEREIPTWRGRRVQVGERSPGEACPPGFYEIP